MRAKDQVCDAAVQKKTCQRIFKKHVLIAEVRQRFVEFVNSRFLLFANYFNSLNNRSMMQLYPNVYIFHAGLSVWEIM